MKNKRKVGLMLMTWVLLLVLALGPLAPGAFAKEAGPGAGVPCAIFVGGGSGG